MSPECQHQARRAGGFPRVSGDEPRQEHEGDALPVFSPRERG